MNEFLDGEKVSFNSPGLLILHIQANTNTIQIQIQICALYLYIYIVCTMCRNGRVDGCK
jgi:hypothetical protein